MVDGQTAAAYTTSAIVMDTLVTIELPLVADQGAARKAAERALGWFGEVEGRCSRFEPDSEVMHLCRATGVETRVSPLLYAVLEFGMSLARLTGGAFDPAVGGRLAELGFVENYRTGARLDARPEAIGAKHTDVTLHPEGSAVTLARPMTIDLGALAKGFAMDLAARELEAFGSYCIDAGGDLLLKGRPGQGDEWAIGIQHPRHDEQVIEVIHLSSGAVCTSGDYERKAADGSAHIVDGRAAYGTGDVISATVVAPTAMAADGLSTAAMVLGTERGLDLLRRTGAEGLLVSRNLRRHQTAGFEALCR